MAIATIERRQVKSRKKDVFYLRAAFYTLGCKVNQYETAVLRRYFSAAGFDIVEPDADADVYIVNSCTVTAEGDRKTRQAVRRFKRQSPGAVVCLTGCFPQAFPELAEQIPEADVITGSKSRAGLLAAVNRRLAGGERVIDVAAHCPGDSFEPMRAGDLERTRAFVKIEDGCDCRCAYCIIPAARGSVRSKPPEELRAELEALCADGYREVVLVGINLSSYGRDLGLRLTDALKLACSVSGEMRVRLGSLEPDLLTSEDISVMAGLRGLCPQFHLSLQSGCDATLARMRRRYDAAGYRRAAQGLRDAFPGCALTTDIMVGFPGETEEEFAQSLAFAEEMEFARMHVFAYSPRPGTAAAEMPGQVEKQEKARRAACMAELAERAREAFLHGQIGRVAAVLVERRDAAGLWEGYSENYTPVLFKGGEELSGTIRTVRITGVNGENCVGELI